MKLTFFEKDLFDRDAYEKPTISVNSQDTNQQTLVKKIATPLSEGSFISGEKNKKIRTIRIPAEYLDFFVDGSKSTGSFKHIKLTSGEPEIVSRTTAPQVTKPIDVSFNVNARLRALEEGPERETTDVTLPSSEDFARSYEPYLIFRLGRAVRLVISNGFSDINRFVRNYTSNTISSVVTAYSNFLRFLQGSFSSGFFDTNNSIISIDQATPDSALPNEFLRKEETTLINQLITYATTRRYPAFINPISETQYWRLRGNIRNTFSIKNISLRGSSVNTRLVLPTKQTISYDPITLQWSNQDGTTRSEGVSNEYTSIIPPRLSLSNFSYNYRSGVSSTTVTGADGNYIRFFVHLAVREYTTGYSSFFNNIRRGTIFRDHPNLGFISLNSNETSITLGGNSVSFFDSRVRGPIRVTLPSILVSLPQNKFVSWIITGESGSLSNSNSSISELASNSAVKSDWDRGRNVKSDGNSLAYLRNINNDLQSIRNTNIPEGISPYTLRPLLETDFTSPTGKVTNSELGFANNNIDINNVRQTGTLLATPTPASHTTTSQLNTNGTRQKNYYYNLTGALRVDNAPLITANNFSIDTQAGTTELKQSLPIYLLNINNNTYQIVDVNFVTNEIAIQKNEGETIRSNELSNLGVENASGVVTEYPLGLGRSSRFNNIQVYYYRNEELVNLFRPVFSNAIRRVLSIFNGVSLPTIRHFIDNRLLSIGVIRNLFTSETKQLKFFIASGQVLSTQTETETTQNQDLLDNVNKSFPHIRLNNILYNTEENRIYLVLARGENSPVPDKSYFSSVKINRRSFNFSSSRYNAYTNPETSPYGSKVAEYSWSYPTNLLGTAQTIPIQFRKSGTSTTNAIDISRLVRKATVNTKDKKEYTEIINNLFVKDIGFTSTSFYIEFSGDIPTTRFQSIALKSQDNNEYITRQLLTTDATVTEDSGKTKFTWNDKPEFAILSYNKQYTIEMISGANSKEKRLFIPIQSKDNFHFVNNYKQTSGNISFNLQRSTFTDNLSKSFVAMALLKESDNSVISGGWYNSNRFIYDTDRKTFTLENSNIIDSPATGTKVLLSFQIHDRDLTEITLLKLTDIFFDTIICLDTNINDLNLLDNNGNPLAHPSDYETIKEVTEDGLRHIFLKLKQPITTKELKLLVRRTSDDANEIRINRMLVLKSIGCFSQYPEVTVNTNQSKTDESSAINTSHITSKPLSINYTLAFPPLTKEKDLSLAQDLFTRASEYNEFLIWVSGGDIAPKIKNLIGYRFIDIVKSLATNDFSVHYVDGRFSSGVDFTIETKQTARINI